MTQKGAACRSSFSLFTQKRLDFLAVGEACPIEPVQGILVPGQGVHAEGILRSHHQHLALTSLEPGKGYALIIPLSPLTQAPSRRRVGMPDTGSQPLVLVWGAQEPLRLSQQQHHPVTA